MRRRHGRHRLPAGRRRGVGRQLQQRRGDRHRRRARRRWPGRRPCAMDLGARKVSPVAGRRRLSHSLHGPGPQPAAQDPGHHHLPRGRGPRRRQCRRPAAHRRSRLGAAAVRPAGEPDPLAPEHHAPRRAGWSAAPTPSACSWSSGPGDSLSTMVRHTLPSVATVAVSVPDDLDRLVDAVSGNTRPARLRRWATRASTSTCPSGW